MLLKTKPIISMKKMTITLENFEGISESHGNQLVGGFSASFSTTKFESNLALADNNCKGGNCVEGCGGNSGCNTVTGCGNTK
jgi:hypothetical protein